jgi:hypothetical protein
MYAYVHTNIHLYIHTGYLGLMLLLDEDTEVLMLVTNSLKQDMGHTNQFVVGQALCAIGDIGSPDICRGERSCLPISCDSVGIRLSACVHAHIQRQLLHLVHIKTHTHTHIHTYRSFR